MNISDKDKLMATILQSSFFSSTSVLVTMQLLFGLLHYQHEYKFHDRSSIPALFGLMFLPNEGFFKIPLVGLAASVSALIFCITELASNISF